MATSTGVTLDLSNRSEETRELAFWFEYKHLALPMRNVSREICAVAQTMIEILDDGPELTAGLRKLLEAKDCLVRQSMISTGTDR